MNAAQYNNYSNTLKLIFYSTAELIQLNICDPFWENPPQHGVGANFFFLPTGTLEDQVLRV